MRFAQPQMLWLLIGTTTLLVWFLAWGWRKKQELATRFIQARLLPQLTANVSPARDRIRLALLVAAVMSAFLALARPQWGFDWEEAKQRGLDIVVAIDTSRSMLARDVQPNRLTRAKLAALDLLQKSRRDRLGLVAFAGAAFLQCPLTLDDEAFRQSVEALDVTIIPQGGTALTEAIDAALTAYKTEGDNFKILVLITDGEDHDSGALEAAERAAKAGLRVFTVGVGTPNGDILQEADDKGGTINIKDPDGNVVKSRLNEGLLQQIASVTGAFYLPLRAANAMDTLYEKGLAPLPKSELASKLIRRYHERYHWPLGAAILLLLVELLLPRGRRQPSSPTARAAAAFGPARAARFILLTTLLLPDQGQADPAFRDYQRGQYEQAAKAYEQRLQQTPTDPRLLYNVGAVAFRRGKYEAAAKAFGQVLTAPDLPLQQRAYYNLGDCLYRLGESQPEAKGRIERWENSVKQFESALKLNPQDADARHNLEFVRKKLEELKQQQQQQPQSDPDNKQDPNKDPKSDESRSSQDQKSPSPPPPGQGGEPPKTPPPQSQSGQQDAKDKPRQDRQTQPSPQEAKQDQQPGQQKDEAQDQAQATPGQMTMQQAEQLLDSQKGEERALIFAPPRKPVDKGRPLKDW
jgi:Ca-activated chloride channel homolog